MPNVNISFQGQVLPIPGSYYSDNVQATIPTNPALVPPMVFIAYGYGGKPFQPQSFPNGGGQALYNALRGAPSQDFVPFISNPSTTLFGASEVIYINCSQNTQSSLALKNGSAVNTIGMVSTDYGPPSNLLQCSVSGGTIAGVAVELFDGFTGVTQQTADNLGVPLQIAYTGAASGVTLSVTAVSGMASYSPSTQNSLSIAADTGATLMTLSSPTSGESLTIPLGSGQYYNCGQLAAYINTTSHFVAQVLPNSSNSLCPTQLLDSSSNIALPAPAGGVNQFVNVTSSPGSILYWMNQFTGMVQASGVVCTTNNTLAQIPLTHFSGATAVAPSLGNYATAFSAAQSVNAWTVFADSTNAGVRALGQQHALACSTPSVGKWRRFITGSEVGDTVSQTQINARSINAYQVGYVYPGVYRTDITTGSNTLYSGLHAAAAVASMMAGNIIPEPLTMKPLVGNGVEKALTLGAGGDIDNLQQAGVMPIYVNPLTQVPTIVSDLTTWQNDNNPENCFMQQVACRQGLAYSLSQGLQPYVGDIASPFGLAKIKKATITILNKLIWSPGNNGFLVGWNPQSLLLTYDGGTQAVNLTVQVTFVGQVRFILELVLVQPLNLSA
jgi:hypothetical protein